MSTTSQLTIGAETSSHVVTPALPTAGRIKLTAHHLPPELAGLAARAFATPGVTPDVLIMLSGFCADAAKVAPFPYWSGAYSRLADLFAFAAPMHSDAPSPDQCRIPHTAAVLRTAARVLETDGPPEILDLAAILRTMASFQPREVS